MATIEKWVNCNLGDLVSVHYVDGNVFSMDNMGNLVGVHVFNKDGTPATLNGNVTANVIRSDGNTVIVNSGHISGNNAWVILPQACYYRPGPVVIVIKLTYQGAVTTLACVASNVYESTTDTIVDPGHVVPDISELLAKISDCELATTNANTAASSANSAASSATSAASSATSATSSANNAASSATSAASSANTAASSANSAASTANTAAGKINNMTVAAEAASGSTPSAVISEVSGHKHILFKLVKGDKGDKGDTGNTGDKGDKGDKGDTGAVPDFSIGTVTTGEPGTDASATITGTPAAPVLNLTIPEGDPGDATIDDTAGIGDTTEVWSADKSKKELDKKSADFSPVILRDYPEAIKTLENCAENMGMGIEIPISPVQDLHGYANPWVGGAGKNIAPVTVSNIKSANTLGTWVDNVYTQANVEFTILTDDAGNVTGIKANGTPNANLGFYIFKDKTIPTGTYTLTGNPVDATTSHDVWLGTFANDAYRDVDYGTGAPVVLASDTMLSLRFRIASGKQVSNVVIKPMIRLSSDTDSTYAPYSNVCPISGFDGVDITRTGINLLCTVGQTNGYYLNASGVPGSDSSFCYTDLIPVKAGQNYYISGKSTKTDVSNRRIHEYDANGTWLRQLQAISVAAGDSYSSDMTISSDACYVKVSYPGNTVGGRTDLDLNPKFVEKNIFQFTWQSSVGTVYGGTVTINEDGSGKLIVDRKKVNVSDCDWTYVTSDKYFWTSIPEIKRGVLNVVTEKFTSDSYIADIPNRVATASGTNGTMSVGISNPYLMIRDYRFTDNTTFKQNSGASVVYELASPVEYTLTPQQITSLFGTNTLWNSIGAFSMSYHLDPKVYVDDIAGMAGSIAKSDSIEASVKTMSDGAENLPMEVEVAINPVQDLHGYEYPWPGGGGKNIAPPISAQTFNDYGMKLVVHDDGHVTVSGPTYTRDVFTPRTVCSMTLPAGSYIFNGQNGVDSANKKLTLQLFNVTTDTQMINRDTADDYAFTLSEPQQIDIRVGYRAGLALSSPVDMYPMIRLSTVSDATWQPYANICPISGWDSVRITETGKNLAKTYTYSGTGSGVMFNYDGEKVTLSNTATASSAIPTYSNTPSNAWFVLKPGTYIPSVHGSNNVGIQVCAGTASAQVILSSGEAFTVSEDTSVFIRVYTINGVNYGTGTVVYMQLERGSVATDYVPYVASVHSISLPTTAYGGTLTVNKDGSGTLVVDKLCVLVNSLTWTYESTYVRFKAVANGVKQGSIRTIPFVTSAFISIDDGRELADVPNNGIYAAGGITEAIYIKSTDYSDATDFVNAYGTQQIVYPLNTSVTYTFTAQQIRSLLGENNLWADSGNVLNVVYRADQGLYISEIANEKADKDNPEFTGSISLGREDGTTKGESSISVGTGLIAKGKNQIVTGKYNTDDGYKEYVSGTTYYPGDCVYKKYEETVQTTPYVVIRKYTKVYRCFVENADVASITQNLSSNHWSHLYTYDGYLDINSLPINSKFAEVVGNGTSDSRANIRELDWNGNEYLTSTLYVYKNLNGGKPVATQEYVTNGISTKADKTDTVLESTLSRGRKESTTIGTGSFAFGSDVEASGDYSHAEGNNTQALGESSHAEGESSIVDEVAMAAHAEGNDTRASATYAHAEGWSTTAVGSASHAEGYESVASAMFAHAEGRSTLASGAASHSEGANTVANHKAQHVGGEFNVEDPSSANVGNRGNYVEIIGNGTGSSAKSNARALDWSGNEYLKGSLYVECDSNSQNGTKVATSKEVYASFVEKSDNTESAVKTISNGANDIPLSLTVAINPVQDTHGFDPYPAGAGKNLCPYTEPGSINQSTGVEWDSTDVTRTGFIKVTTSGTYTLSNIATTNRVRFFEYDSSKTFLRTYASTDTISDGKLTFTVGNDVGYIRIQGLNAVFPNENAQVESGSTATSYMPYSNICPISGWDTVDITRTGANLYDGTVIEGYISDDGIEGTDGYNAHSDYIPVVSGQKYTYVWKTNLSSNVNRRIHGYYANKTWKEMIDKNVTSAFGSKTFTVPADVAYIRVQFRYDSTYKDYDIQIEQGETVSPYDHFNISLPTTAYGGTLTVNKDGSGKLIVDRGIATENSFTSFNTKSNNHMTGYVGTDESGAKISGIGISNMLPVDNNDAWNDDFPVAQVSPSTQGRLRIYGTFTSLADFKTQFAGLQFVYELASPVSYDFTAQQIRSLLGENNLWADSGNVLEVRYFVDSAMYIDKKTENPLPAVTSADNGKVLRVVDGVWSAVSLPSASGTSF